MPDQSQQNSTAQTNEASSNELETLRKEVDALRTANKEILAKKDKHKNRSVELETTVTQLQQQLADSKNILTEAVVNVPLRQISEKVSDVPDIWMKLFKEMFGVEVGKDGKLTVTADGKPAMKGGMAVNFDHLSLSQLVTEHNSGSDDFGILKWPTSAVCSGPLHGPSELPSLD
jgi:hypothetical protein